MLFRQTYGMLWLLEGGDTLESKNGFKVVIVILVILLLGAIGYICYDRFSTQPMPKKGNSPVKEQLIEGNTFDLESINCVGTDVCEKSVKLAYNNKNHTVKLVKKANSNKKYDIEVYVDGSLVDTLDGGQFPDYENASSGIKNLDGFIYVIDSKYLGLVYREDSEHPSWYIKFYNDKKASASEKIRVASMGQGIASESLGSDKDLNKIDALEFENNMVKYYKVNCDIKVSGKYYAAVEKHSLSFDGNTVNDSVEQVLKDGIGLGGQGFC